jgi:hypothetical protein
LAGGGRRGCDFGGREVVSGDLDFELLQAGTGELDPDQLVIELEDSADAPRRHFRVPDERVFFECHVASTMAQVAIFANGEIPTNPALPTIYPAASDR